MIAGGASDDANASDEEPDGGLHDGAKGGNTGHNSPTDQAHVAAHGPQANGGQSGKEGEDRSAGTRSKRDDGCGNEAEHGEKRGFTGFPKHEEKRGERGTERAGQNLMLKGALRADERVADLRFGRNAAKDGK